MDEELPSWVDERVHHLFHLGQVPIRPRETDCWRYGWNSSKDGLMSTKTVMIDGTNTCVYCGHRALPIQNNLLHNKFLSTDDYKITGYCCVCSKACDEVIVENKIAALEEAHQKAVKDLKKMLPSPDMDVLITRRHEALQRKVKHGVLSLSDIEDLNL
jgi:hypothetical protein